MSDASRRAAERRAKQDPTDPEAVARAAAEAERAGDGELAMLRAWIGRQCYGEGARMNYRFVLVDVYATPLGGPASLRCRHMRRLVNWTSSGPTVEEPVGAGEDAILPWSYVHMIGLAPSNWPKLS